MRAKGVRATVWTLCALTIVVASLGLALNLAGDPASPDLDYGLPFVLLFLVFAATGTLIALRVPGSPLGWLLLASGLLWELSGALAGYANYAVLVSPPGWPGGPAAAWVLSWLWILTLGLVPFLFVLFPDGVASTSVGRWVLRITVPATVAAVAGRAFVPGPMQIAGGIGNPLGLDEPFAWPGPTADAAANLLGVCMMAAIVVFVLRFRRATGPQRQQLRWLAYAGALVVAAFVVGDRVAELGHPAIGDNIRVPSLLAIPIAMAIAVLRYRLYDIDVVISRTVVYGGLIAFITGTYLGMVAAAGALVGSQAHSNLGVAVLVTAVVALAFQPFRERLQQAARRLVFGKPTPQEQQAGVSVTCLGAFRVIRPDGPLSASAWQSKKARTLLKILIARRGRATPREVLMEALWPGEEPQAVTRRLSVALATLRAVLDPDKRHPADHFVAGDRDALQADLSHLPVDVERFLATAAAGQYALAESLYTGDFLEEDAYEDWAQPLRDEARAAYVTVLRELATGAWRAGDADGATRRYLRVLEIDPWDEGAHLALVGVLDAAGRHGEARRRYRAYTAKMAEIRVPASPFPTRDVATGPASARP